MVFDEVKAYIEENILHTAGFEALEEKIQRKAVNNAENVLYSIYARYDSETKPLPIEAIAYQALFILAKDDSEQRADNGATYLGFNGVALTYAQKQRTVSPDVVRILGRKVGSYSVTVPETHRGMYDR